MNNKSEVVNIITKAMRIKGYTQKTLADAVEVKQPYICAFLRQGYSTNIPMLKRITALLGITDGKMLAALHRDHKTETALKWEES